MATKFSPTPGPWQTSLSDDTVVIHIGADGVHHEVASIDGDYNEPDQWPVMEANARLISAAPDLLVALIAYRYAQRALVDKWAEGDANVRRGLWQQLHDCESVADAAIAKATGK